jgi:hypothetical protein
MRLVVLALTALAVACTGCPPAPVVPSPTLTTPVKPTTTVSVKDPMQSRTDAAIQLVVRRELGPEHGFWTVFHGILGLGPDVMLVDRKNNRRVKALDYIREGGQLEGLQFITQPQGVDVYTAGPSGGQFYAQGHQDQFVAEVAQWGVRPEVTFKVNGQERRFADFIQFTKARASVKRNQELAWAVHVIGEYEGTDAKWTNMYGEAVTLEELVRYELDSPMDADQAIKQGQLPLACGGTHRLFGLSWVLHLHLNRGGKLTGVWKDAHDRLNELKQNARRNQHTDGSFSTSWFSGKGAVNDPSQRLATTGHILEWLALALTDEELKEPWVEQAVSYLCELFFELDKFPVEGGALYHAVHGLTIYHARRFGTERLGPYTPYVHLAPGCKPVVRPQ